MANRRCTFKVYITFADVMFGLDCISIDKIGDDYFRNHKSSYSGPCGSEKDEK